MKMDILGNKLFSLFIPTPIIWCLDRELGNHEPLLGCKTLRLGLNKSGSQHVEPLVVLCSVLLRKPSDFPSFRATVQAK